MDMDVNDLVGVLNYADDDDTITIKVDDGSNIVKFTIENPEATLIDVTHDGLVSETMILKARHINYPIGREYDVEALANYISMRITPSNHLFSRFRLFLLCA
ncbi:hypothetical protein ACSQ67_008114 [Phaseolus vulgaris]